MAYREPVSIVHSSAGIGGANSKKGKAAAAANQSKRGRGSGTSASSTGRQFGRPKVSSAKAMSQISFRGTLGGVEGRLPREVGVVRIAVPLCLAIGAYEPDKQGNFGVHGGRSGAHYFS